MKKNKKNQPIMASSSKHKYVIVHVVEQTNWDNDAETTITRMILEGGVEPIIFLQALKSFFKEDWEFYFKCTIYSALYKHFVLAANNHQGGSYEITCH